MIASRLNNKFKYLTAEDVLAEMSQNIPEFRGLDYEKIGISGTLLEIKNPEPAEKV